MPFIPALSRAALGGLVLAIAAPAVAQTPLVLIDGWATLTLTPEDVLVRTQSGDLGLDVTLTNGQGQLLRVMAAQPDDNQVDHLRRFLDTVGEVAQGQAGGQAVWQVQGTTDRSPMGRRGDAAFEVRMVIPQLCLSGGEAVAIAVTADPGNAAAAEALLAGLTLTRPEGAQDCALADLPALLAGGAIPEAPETPVALADPVPEAAPETVPMMGDLAFLTLTAGARVSGTDSFNGSTEVVVDANGELVRFIGAPLQSPLSQTVPTLLHRVDDILSTDLGGQPAWVLSGPSRVTMFYADAPVEDAIPARVIVPMACVAGQPAYVIAVVADPGHDAPMDPLISAMTLGAPQGATPCDLSIDALLQGGPAPEGPAPQAALATGDHGKLPMSGAAPQTAAMPQESFLSAEMALWADAASQNRPQGFWTYLKAYPNGQFAELARTMLALVQELAEPAPQPAAPAPRTK